MKKLLVFIVVLSSLSAFGDYRWESKLINASLINNNGKYSVRVYGKTALTFANEMILAGEEVDQSGAKRDVIWNDRTICYLPKDAERCFSDIKDTIKDCMCDLNL